MSINVSLREVADSDVDVFFEYQRDPASNAMAAVAARQRDKHDAHWRKIRAQETTILRTIDVDGAVAGHALSWIGDDGRRLVGYWLGQDFWGRGIASTALSLLVREVADRPLFALVAKHNRGSQRVLEKSGFEVASEGSILVAYEEIAEFIYKLDK